MDTIFPQADGFSGIFLVGFRKHPAAPASTQRIGTVVVKRSYTISGGLLLADPGGESLRLGDERGITTTIELDGDDLEVELVTHESDIAPYKPGADLFVKGFVADPADPASVSVAGSVWLARPAAAGCLEAEDVEVNHNLFGWEQRGFAARLADVGTNPRDPAKQGFSDHLDDYPAQWPVPPAPPFRDPLNGNGFSNRFYNAYRRCFKVPGGSFPYFQDGWEIRVQRDPGGASEAQTVFSLPDDELSARYFFYCGHGPDRASRWCDAPITLVKDTLVVEPGQQRAYLLWRGVWDFDNQPEDRYRRLEVTLEA